MEKRPPLKECLLAKRDYKKVAIDYGVMVVCAVLYALCFTLFITPNNFAPSGVGGIVSMLQYKLGISVGYLYLLFNVPLCIAAFFIVRRKFAGRTLFFSLLYSVVQIVIDSLPLDNFKYITNGVNSVLPALAAGVITGLVFGLNFKHDSSSGGTDVMGAIIQKLKPEYNLVWIIFTLNAIVACASYFVYAEPDPVTGVMQYDFEPVILCIIVCFVSSKVTDAILSGTKAAVKFEVITDHPEEIAAAVIKELHHTATVINARGMYNNDEKKMLVCVVNKREVVEFRKIIDRYPGAFAYMTSVSETVGLFRRSR